MNIVDIAQAVADASNEVDTALVKFSANPSLQSVRALTEATQKVNCLANLLEVKIKKQVYG